MSAGLLTLKTFVSEQRLARRLVVDLTGITTVEQRRDRIRAAIIERGVADAQATRSGIAPQTYRAAFERIYGEPLETTENLFAPHGESR